MHHLVRSAFAGLLVGFALVGLATAPAGCHLTPAQVKTAEQAAAEDVQFFCQYAGLLSPLSAADITACAVAGVTVNDIVPLLFTPQRLAIAAKLGQPIPATAVALCPTATSSSAPPAASSAGPILTGRKPL